jgi:hypothetical protein
MKTVLYFFLFSILILSCKKEVSENKDLNKLNADILFLLKKTDSLSSSIALNIIIAIANTITITITSTIIFIINYYY